MAVPPMGLRSLMTVGLGAVVLGGLDELVEERLDLGGEADELEAVAVVEVLDAETQRLLGLLELLAGHRAGGVEHEADVLGLDRVGGFAGGGQQQEVAVLVGSGGRSAGSRRGLRPGEEERNAVSGGSLRFVATWRVVAVAFDLGSCDGR